MRYLVISTQLYVQVNLDKLQTMGNYENEVREKVGIEEFDLILEAARRGEIEAGSLSDLSFP